MDEPEKQYDKLMGEQKSVRDRLMEILDTAGMNVSNAYLNLTGGEHYLSDREELLFGRHEKFKNKVFGLLDKMVGDPNFLPSEKDLVDLEKEAAEFEASESGSHLSDLEQMQAFNRRFTFLNDALQDHLVYLQQKKLYTPKLTERGLDMAADIAQAKLRIDLRNPKLTDAELTKLEKQIQDFIETTQQ